MKNSFRLFKTVTLFVLLICCYTTIAQNNSTSGIKYIQQLIEKDSLVKAKNQLQNQLDFYRGKKNTDSLIKYVFLVGSLKLANGKHDLAIKKAEAFGKELEKYNSNYINKEVLLEIAWIYDDAGYAKKSYLTVEKALKIAKNIKNPKKAGLSAIYHNLGYMATNLGDYALAKKQYAKSIKILKKEPIKDFESLHKTYNALGGMMWYSAKLDSSLYYFKQAGKMLDSVEKTPMNLYYRPALVKMNIAVISQTLGQIDDAIKSSKEVISSFQNYLDISDDESRKLRALKHQLAAIDNLGSFYHSIGEFERADKLITYSYQKKLETLAPDDSNITISQIISAQAKMGLRDFDAANTIINQALKRINTSKNTQFFWQAAALSTKATISDEIGDYKNANKYFKIADSLYRKSLGNKDYTRDFLDEIIDMSQFYAKVNNASEAITLAEESYNFIKTSDFKNTLQSFYHILNLAEVHYKLKNYIKALTYSEEALHFLEKNKIISNNFADSIQVQYRKPKALLINAKSKYQLNPHTSKSFLNSLLEQLENGIKILEQRKTIIKSYEDLSLLISENDELFNFSKQLLLDLYNLTKEEIYLTKLVTIHESSLYNRIRTRLNLKNVTFANIPLKITQREKLLKNNLSTSLNNSNNTIKSFFKAEQDLKIFLDSLKHTYPKYYKMRYATIEEPLDDLQNNIPNNTTVVRYLFFEDNLYAFVANKTQKNIYKLNAKNLKETINQLTKNQSNITETSSKLQQLYNQLWQPFETKIKTENIIIIPDGELFNLSFETLTPTKISAFKDLSTHSLLAKYAISYNYSLLLLDENRKTVNYSNDFIAFAPEFNDKMKEDYKVAVTDSLNLDKTYLTLLPQPFSLDLAKQFSKLFNGESFLNENASKTIFEQEANEHKIIHIGTHAESNNVSPELSRLIFAKNKNNSDNSLYTYEIYNQNLNSNLAILTACETGKPTYQSGEGMISLAHAFNYAGSESILTSLWKIDEQSSAKIMQLFYNYLSEGLTKNKALRKAKLDYITTAEGRTIAPQYWAGLVLIGDIAPLELKVATTNVLYWAFGLIALILLIVAIRKLKITG